MGRLLSVLALLVPVACATARTGHSRAQPVNWSLGSSDSGIDDTVICSSDEPKPCVLRAGTTERTMFATFTLHVQSRTPRRFTGSIIVGFFGHLDPRQFESRIDLTSDGHDVHQSLTDRVTGVRGSYTVRIYLEESGADLQTSRKHDFVVPVQVK